MHVADMTIDARRLWPGEMPWDGPLAFVDLDSIPDFPEQIALPPCPVVGLGDPSHPLAASLDTIIEDSVSAEAIAKQVLAMPKAASVIAQLLRILPAVSPQDGLTLESLAYAVLQGSEEHARWLALPRETLGVRAPGQVTLMREDSRLIVMLDRPESGNAIDRHMRDQLFEAFSLAALDPDIGKVALRGAGRTFSLGAELSEFGTTIDPATAHAIRCHTLPAHVLVRCAEKLEVHVQGGCVGSGLELAAWASRFTASQDAWFHLPELSMGILPGAGGCVSLSRRIGRQRTALMILSGKRITARKALGWGLVDAIVDEPSGNEGGANIA